MELRCLPTETPASASSCSTDPLYDNCPPFALRETDGKKETESRVACPVVSGLPGPGSPLPGLVPALAEVQTAVGGGREAGSWPNRSYYSCRGRQPWELYPNTNKEREWEDKADGNRCPSPSQSEEHRSVLSLYDNLPLTGRTESLQEVFDMEHSREDLYPTVGLMQGDAENHNLWPTCDIFQNQDKEEERNPEQDSGSCGFLQEDLLMQSKFFVPFARELNPSPSELCQVRLSSAEQPKIPPPVPLADPSASALRSLLTSLQQQIIRQREEYETRIISLEQRNEELQVEVVRLKTNLSQQRHWYQAVQAKIAESERARAAAELRNATLQKEMEQFFDTFGELNNEAKKTEYIVKSF